jgi:hypothetical protein
MEDGLKKMKDKKMGQQHTVDGAQVSAQSTEELVSNKRLVDLEFHGYIRNVYADIVTKSDTRIPVLLRGVARKDRNGQRFGTYLILRNLSDKRGYAGDQLEAVQLVLKSIITGNSDISAGEKMNEILEQYPELNGAITEIKKTIKKLEESVRILKDEKDKLAGVSYESGIAQEDCRELEARLQKKIVRLEQLNEIAIGRELKMIEMKEELERLRGVKQAIG